MKIQQEYGLNESLAALHQIRRVVLVVMIVDPGKRCLMISGDLPQEDHTFGRIRNNCALPYVNGVVQSLGVTRERVHGLARTYDDESAGPVSKRTYVVVRVDVDRSWAIRDGEWVATAEQALRNAKGNTTPLRCIQKYFGEELAWKSSDQALN